MFCYNLQGIRDWILDLYYVFQGFPFVRFYNHFVMRIGSLFNNQNLVSCNKELNVFHKKCEVLKPSNEIPHLIFKY